MRHLKLLIVFLTLVAFSRGEAASAPRSCEEVFSAQIDLAPIVRKAATEIDGRTVYFENIAAQAGKPTALVFMGLFTPISDLHAFQREWVKQRRGEGLTIFSYSTQFESVAARVYSQNKDVVVSKLDVTDLVREATAVVNAAGVRGAVTAIGYSYGSIIASRFAEFHKDRVSNLVLAAPYVEAGEHNPQMLSAKAMLETMAALNPFFGATMLNNSRDQAAEDMATQIIDEHLADHAFPERIRREDMIGLLKSQIRVAEATNLLDEMKPGFPATTLVLAEKENVSRLHLQEAVARAARVSGRGGHIVKIANGAHPVLADKPRETVEAILTVMRDTP